MPIETLIEEYEQGAWIADLKDIEPLTGSFDFVGSTWVGSVFSQKENNGIHAARIVGGAGGLSSQVGDLYYVGGAGFSEIVKAIADRGGESVGFVESGNAQTYTRIRGTVGRALDRFSETFGFLWWISRTGELEIRSERQVSPEASGVLEKTFSDGSVLISQPENVEIGGTWGGETIRHVRWFQTADRFEAQLYFSVLDLGESLGDYDRIYSARVDSQQNDGFLDLIVAGRFEVSKVPFLSGIPTAKLTIEPGDLVALGFYGGDPRKPFALATAQGSGSKAVARVDDTTESGTLTGVAPAGTAGGPVTFTYTPPGGAAATGTSIDIIGIITSGNERILL